MRGRGVEQRIVAVRGWSTPLTGQVDGVEHEIADADLAAGRGSGRYRAVCGVVVAPAALTARPGRPCRACAAEVDPAPEAAADAHALRRALSAWVHQFRLRAERPRMGEVAW